MATILIVDDDLNIRYLFRCLLQQVGHNIIEAEDGNQAIDLINNHRNEVDLLITDVLMPNKEGLELIKEVKKKYPKLKIIALSGGGIIGVNDCLAFADVFGADKVFPKPISRTELLSAVTELVA